MGKLKSWKNEILIVIFGLIFAAFAYFNLIVPNRSEAVLSHVTAKNIEEKQTFLLDNSQQVFQTFFSQSYFLKGIRIYIDEESNIVSNTNGKLSIIVTDNASGELVYNDVIELRNISDSVIEVEFDNVLKKCKNKEYTIGVYAFEFGDLEKLFLEASIEDNKDAHLIDAEDNNELPYEIVVDSVRVYKDFPLPYFLLIFGECKLFCVNPLD